MFCKRIPLISQKFKNILKTSISTSSPRQFKVVVVGSGGGVGQPLSLLLKLNPLVTKLALYDIIPSNAGVTLDVSHINNCTTCEGYFGPEQLGYALCGANLVVVCACGSRRKSTVIRAQLFKVNAQVMYDLARAMSSCCPRAAISIITNPVNALVPLTAMVMYKNGVYDPRKYFGFNSLDMMRAAKYVAELNHSDPQRQLVPCIGGHDDVTIIPLLSRSNPPVFLPDDAERDKLIDKIRKAGPMVVKAKGNGPATLSTAYGAARLSNAILRGFAGETNVIDGAYIRSNVTDSCYFSSPLLLGPHGVEEIYDFNPINEYEKSMVKKAIPHLQDAIKQGENFVLKQIGEL